MNKSPRKPYPDSGFTMVELLVVVVTRLHVATSTIDAMLDYTLNTPEDPLRTAKCVEQRIALIRRNPALA